MIHHLFTCGEETLNFNSLNIDEMMVSINMIAACLLSPFLLFSIEIMILLFLFSHSDVDKFMTKKQNYIWVEDNKILDKSCYNSM